MAAPSHHRRCPSGRAAGVTRSSRPGARRSRRTTIPQPRAPAVSLAAPCLTSAEAGSRGQRQFLPQLGRAHRLTVTGSAALESACIAKLAHDDRLESGVAHQPRSNSERLAVISRNRDGKLRIRTVRLAREDHIGKRVERTHEPRAGQIFLRSDSDSIALHLVRDRTIASGYRVAGVEHYLALEDIAVLLSDLRQRAVGHRDEQRVAERNRLLHRSILSERTESGHQLLQLLGMPR